MYSGFYLGLLAFVAIIPLYETAIALPTTGLVGCENDDVCKKNVGLQSQCCNATSPMPVPTTLSMPKALLAALPRVCAPTGTVCCTTNNDCTQAKVSSFTTDGVCCPGLSICLTKDACTSLACTKGTPTCPDNLMCCITPVTVDGIPVTIPDTAAGTCLPKSSVTSTACALLK